MESDWWHHPGMGLRAVTRRWGLLAVIVVVALALLVGVRSDWTVTRTTRIAAGPHDVYREAADLHRWDAWTAWSSRADPALTRTFGGALMGKGATMTWTGPRLGHGTVTVTEADPLGAVGWRTETDDGVYTCRLTWTAPASSATEVIWTCRGDEGWTPAARWRALGRGATLGPELAEGLAGLASAAEALHQASDADRAAHPRPPRSAGPPPPP